MNFSRTADTAGQTVTPGDIDAAARRLAGIAVRTHILESPLLNQVLGCRLLIKAEPLQRTGSFKFRGAYNAISQLDAAQRQAGVVAYSSGNHAQGVAAAARMLGVPATIVMPSDAPAIKIANTRAWGAEVVLYDRERDNREAIGGAIAASRGADIVKPYDDPRVIAGQGTIGLEIAQQCAEMGITPDSVLIPCGGGGLTSGTALALSRESPRSAIWAVEPEDFDDTCRSLAEGRRLGLRPGGKSICDALLSPMPGEITFPLLKSLGVRGLAVSDAAVRDAMTTAFTHFKLVVEPGGAVALAAVLDETKRQTMGQTIVCVCSGGNVDPALFADILAGSA